MLFALAVATVPTAVIGFLLSDFFESLFASLRTVGFALTATGFYLFLTKYAREKPRNFFGHPFIIGILQGVAIIPGFSRSGLTIGGALFLGWKRAEAARFSFLLSIPAIFGAALFQYSKIGGGTQPWAIIITGVVVSAIFGYLALVLLVSVINKGNFYAFSFYCFLIGSTAIVYSFLT
jgi:undecaprenyl-diphosphatase